MLEIVSGTREDQLLATFDDDADVPDDDSSYESLDGGDDLLVRTKSEAQDILDIASHCVGGLFRITALIKKATPRDRFGKALRDRRSPFTDQFDINYIQERYPKLAGEDSKWLRERLGHAITNRRQYLRYCREHRERLEAPLPPMPAMTVDGTEDPLPRTPGLEAEAGSQEVRQHTAVPCPDLVSPPNPGPSVQTRLSTKASTLDIARLQVALDASFVGDDDAGDATTYSSAPSSAGLDSGENRLQLPTLERASGGSSRFECMLCREMQSITRERSWKRHAYRDLKAYVCTLGKGECGLEMFTSPEAWFDHELRKHRQQWTCAICGGGPFRAAENFQSHVSARHGELEEAQVAILRSVSQSSPSVIPALDCPFCDEWEQKLRELLPDSAASGRRGDAPETVVTVGPRQFRRHVGAHLQQLALFAVPRAQDEPEDEDEGSMAGNMHAVSVDCTQMWMSEGKLSFASVTGAEDSNASQRAALEKLKEGEKPPARAKIVAAVNNAVVTSKDEADEKAEAEAADPEPVREAPRAVGPDDAPPPKIGPEPTSPRSGTPDPEPTPTPKFAEAREQPQSPSPPRAVKAPRESDDVALPAAVPTSPSPGSQTQMSGPSGEDATIIGVVTREPESIAPTETQTPAPGDAGEDEWAETPSEKRKGKMGKQQSVPTFPPVPIVRQRKDPCRFTILLIGVTGAGKSTFAAHASGANVVIGDDLDPCTRDPLAVPFHLDEQEIVLIDTPGFDDDKRSDVEILVDVAKWINQGMLSKILTVNALILLHPITRNDVTGNEKRRTRLLEKLLGEDAYKRVTIATTMWGTLAPEYAAELERDLIKKSNWLGEGGLWGDFRKRGATVERHDNTKESAHNIIRRIVARSNEAEKSGTQRHKDTADRNVISLNPSFFEQLIDDLEDDIVALREDIILHREEEPAMPFNRPPNLAEKTMWNEWESEKQRLEERIQRYEMQFKKLRNTLVSTYLISSKSSTHPCCGMLTLL